MNYFSISFICIVHIISAFRLVHPHFTEICPQHFLRQQRGKTYCNKTHSAYICIKDLNERKFIEICREKPELYQEGYKAVFLGNLNSKKCEQTRYQPIIFSTDYGSDCIFKRSTCGGEGQLGLESTSSDRDIQCRCDYTKGYAFVTQTKNQCFCVPSEEDCTCFKKQCPTKYILAADYTCKKEEDDDDGCHDNSTCSKYCQSNVVDDKNPSTNKTEQFTDIGDITETEKNYNREAHIRGLIAALGILLGFLDIALMIRIMTNSIVRCSHEKLPKVKYLRKLLKICNTERTETESKTVSNSSADVCYDTDSGISLRNNENDASLNTDLKMSNEKRYTVDEKSVHNEELYIENILVVDIPNKTPQPDRDRSRFCKAAVGTPGLSSNTTASSLNQQPIEPDSYRFPASTEAICSGRTLEAATTSPDAFVSPCSPQFATLGTPGRSSHKTTSSLIQQPFGAVSSSETDAIASDTTITSLDFSTSSQLATLRTSHITTSLEQQPLGAVSSHIPVRTEIIYSKGTSETDTISLGKKVSSLCFSPNSELEPLQHPEGTSDTHKENNKKLAMKEKIVTEILTTYKKKAELKENENRVLMITPELDEMSTIKSILKSTIGIYTSQHHGDKNARGKGGYLRGKKENKETIVVKETILTRENDKIEEIIKPKILSAKTDIHAVLFAMTHGCCKKYIKSLAFQISSSEIFRQSVVIVFFKKNRDKNLQSGKDWMKSPEVQMLLTEVNEKYCVLNDANNSKNMQELARLLNIVDSVKSKLRFISSLVDNLENRLKECEKKIESIFKEGIQKIKRNDRVLRKTMSDDREQISEFQNNQNSEILRKRENKAVEILNELHRNTKEIVICPSG